MQTRIFLELAWSRSAFYSALVLLVFLLFQLVPREALAQEDNQARAYFFAAEDAYRNGEYADALADLDQVKKLLNSSNARVAGLEVRILVAQADYLGAQAKLQELYTYPANDGVLREMAQYMELIEKRAPVQASNERMRDSVGEEFKELKESYEALPSFWSNPVETLSGKGNFHSFWVYTTSEVSVVGHACDLEFKYDFYNRECSKNRNRFASHPKDCTTETHYPGPGFPNKNRIDFTKTRDIKVSIKDDFMYANRGSLEESGGKLTWGPPVAGKGYLHGLEMGENHRATYEDDMRAPLYRFIRAFTAFGIACEEIAGN